MKTAAQAVADAAPIVRVATGDGEVESRSDAGVRDGAAALLRAKSFAEPLLAGHLLDTGEDAWAHAEGVAQILAAIGAAPSMQAAAYLVYAGDHLQRPEEMVAQAFGPSYAQLVVHTRKLVQIQRAAREAAIGVQRDAEREAEQLERVRKMLLAFSRDLRVVLLRLASRLQTLRWHTQSKVACPQALAMESRQVFAPLASRLGIWQIKWELEDLSFRFLEPEAYRQVARLLDEKRIERESGVERIRLAIAADLQAHAVAAEVQGRPKHLYSIWKKMQGKGLHFEQLNDLRAVRVIVADVARCYAALARVHERWGAVSGEFNDYIARPKANGYQSLHTVVQDDSGRAVEVQIRTREMHEAAEYGVAAHWAYKEAGVRGYAGVTAAGEFEERMALARKSVLRQLLEWEREFAGAGGGGAGHAFDDRIYVFTPQATVIELAAGATPVDFAYALHTDLGHRCRGARVDGAMVPLHTALANGQTVEIVSTKEGGPSLDWLNAELGFLKSPRSKAKVRAWFNAQAQRGTVARGRELVEKLLQREGRTAMKLDDLAEKLGFKGADALFEVVGKDEFSLRNIEQLLRPPAPAEDDTEQMLLRRSRAGDGGVLVVGVESLLTSLARCCRPAPPDAIGGFVTRGKGVAIHRTDCLNLRHMQERSPQRVIAVAWGKPRGERDALYPVDVLIEAADRHGLLRDISEVFAKEKINVTGVKSQTLRDARGATAMMTVTVELADVSRLAAVLATVARVAGVRGARRR